MGAINYDAFSRTRFGERRLLACWRRQLADAFFSAMLPKKAGKLPALPGKDCFGETPKPTRETRALPERFCTTRFIFSVSLMGLLPLRLLQPRRSNALPLFCRPILPRRSRCIYRATFSLPDRKRCWFSDRRTPAQRPIHSLASSHCRDRSRQRRKDSH